MDIQIIGKFRFALTDALNMLSRLGGKRYELPSIADLKAMTERLENTSPFDVIASIMKDDDYKKHRQMYLEAFGGVLDCEANLGEIKTGCDVVNYWSGLIEKLSTSKTDADLYVAEVGRLSQMIDSNARAMKADLIKLFADTSIFPKPEEIKTLHPSLSKEKVEAVYTALLNMEFIAQETTLNNWLVVFGFMKGKPEPIEWTAQNSRTREISKSSLLDLLTLMGCKVDDIKKNVNSCFVVYNGNNISKFGSQDFSKAFKYGTLPVSEYHTAFEKMVKKSKK